jgi:hypothetical protein
MWSGEFAALQEELTRRAELHRAPENVMSAIAYCTCMGDLKVVLGMLDEGVLRAFLADRLES